MGFSSLIFVVALFFSLALHESEDGSLALSFPFFGWSPEDKLYRQLGPIPQLDPPVIHQFSSLENLDTVKAAYIKDGVVAVRGLIDQPLLDRLDKASRIIVQEQLVSTKLRRGDKSYRRRNGTQFFTSNHGVVFLDPPQFTTMEDQETSWGEKLPPFLKVAVDSLVPHVAALLLHANRNSTTSESNKETLRLIRDIFLAKDDDPYVCGWHVDDFGFWPATPDSLGINAWIALDEYVRHCSFL